MIFLSFIGIFSFYVASLNGTKKKLDNRVRNVYIIYDHSISDVPKHSSDGGLNPRPPECFLSPVKTSALNPEKTYTSNHMGIRFFEFVNCAEKFKLCLNFSLNSV